MNESKIWIARDFFSRIQSSGGFLSTDLPKSEASMANSYSILFNTSQLLSLEGPYASDGTPRRPGEMQDLGIHERGAIVFNESGVLAVGSEDELRRQFPDPDAEIDVEGRMVMPGLVDCHTHLVFGGNRSEEMMMRLQGATYLDILKAGGGINHTVKATRQASVQDLTDRAAAHLDRMLEHGTTCVEVKTGYGLDEPTEMKILDVVGELEQLHPMTLFRTFLGAHTVPKGVDRQAYLDWLKGPSLAAFQRKATFFDVFCEDGAFSKEETLDLLRHAKEAGFHLKLHAGQFNDLGVCTPAAEMGTVSIDHLDHISDDQLQAMAKYGCVGVMLPGVPFFLKTGIYPDARRFHQMETPFAIATDFNPGSCPSFSMQMMIALAVLECRATLEEAICGATYNAACALGAGKNFGSLAPGKAADLIVLDVESYNEIPYYFGGNLVQSVFKGGELVGSSTMVMA